MRMLVRFMQADDRANKQGIGEEGQNWAVLPRRSGGNAQGLIRRSGFGRRTRAHGNRIRWTLLKLLPRSTIGRTYVTCYLWYADRRGMAAS
jgi:hypothetical protein